MGTLTGAARVALGPELPPYYTDDEALAADVARHAAAENDPLWRLPLWMRYDQNIDSKVADVNNVATGGMAGSIICALFLKRFVTAAKSWLHFDIYAWTPSAKPGRPEGGECQAARALYALLKQTIRLHVHRHQGQGAAHHHDRRAAAPELVHRQPARPAAVAGLLAAGLSRAAFRLPRLPCRGPAPRRHRHLRRRRRAARRRRRRPQLGELRDRADRRHRRAARRGAAGGLHGRQGAGRPDVGGDRDPHDAAGHRQDRRDHAAARPRLQGDRADDRPAGEDRLDLGADSRADADRRALQGPARSC